MSWKQLCRARDQGGWGILDLKDFNHALLGNGDGSLRQGLPGVGLLLYVSTMGEIIYLGVYLPHLPSEDHSFGFETSVICPLSEGIRHKLLVMGLLFFSGLIGGLTVTHP